MDDNNSPSVYSLKNFLPLIVIGTLIVLFTIVRAVFYRFYLDSMMRDFMGSFFIVFGAFKIINLKGFAESYSTYDIIAKRSVAYAYSYPFIELIVGFLYLMNYTNAFVHLVTLCFMIIGSIGVAHVLLRKQPIRCACLGAVFNIPMTYVSLAEDLIMASMALIMMLKS